MGCKKVRSALKGENEDKQYALVCPDVTPGCVLLEIHMGETVAGVVVLEDKLRKALGIKVK